MTEFLANEDLELTRMNSTEDERIVTVVDMNLVASLEKKVSDTKFRDRNREPTIYRVPDILKKVDPQAYEPLLISLGPYHQDKPHLQTMNQLKWKYLKFVLEQTSGVALVDYVDRITRLETRARNAYSEEVKMSSNNFVEMMLLDGCFVILTIMQLYKRMTISEESTVWIQIEVLEDIFKLENQLPFFLLETLYESAFPQGPPFQELTVHFICMHTSSDMELPSNDETFHHIIHLCLSCIDPTKNHGNGNQSSTFGFLCRSKLAKTVVSFPPKLCSSLLSQVKKKFTVGDGNPGENLLDLDLGWIPSATVLNEAGIHFKRKQEAKSFLDITFHNGKLKIPTLRIDDGTNSFLRNLIAYEQCSMSSKPHVTAYTELMDYLIDSAADMELLQQDDIIINSLGDNQQIATLFNKIGLHVISDISDSYLVDVINAIKKHRNRRYNKWRARLNRDYFGNPWAVISLFGALVLFILTVIQTIYSVLSYVH